VATFKFYRRPVAGLRTKDEVLAALYEALDEVQDAIQEGSVTSTDLAEALTFLKRYFERLERLILSDGLVDYKALVALQKSDPLLVNAAKRFARQQQRLLNK
jgi:hypothetical protein